MRNVRAWRPYMKIWYYFYVSTRARTSLIFLRFWPKQTAIHHSPVSPPICGCVAVMRPRARWKERGRNEDSHILSNVAHWVSWKNRHLCCRCRCSSVTAGQLRGRLTTRSFGLCAVGAWFETFSKYCLHFAVWFGLWHTAWTKDRDCKQFSPTAHLVVGHGSGFDLVPCFFFLCVPGRTNRNYYLPRLGFARTP